MDDRGGTQFRPGRGGTAGASSRDDVGLAVPHDAPDDGDGVARPGALDPVNILLVDDRPENLVALAAMLEAPGYNLVTARSGPEALRRLLRDEFALVLLDVLMPEMDGFEVAALIRQRDPSRRVPIIFLTALGRDVGSIYRGYTSGAVDYLVKPIDPEVVRAKVAVFVELHRKNQKLKVQGERLRQTEAREQALRIAELQVANQRRYQNLAEAIPQIVWTATPAGAASYFNRRWVDLTGVACEGAVGWTWLDALHPDDAARCAAEWRAAVAAGEPYESECRLRRASDGAYVWHLCRAVPECGCDGEVVAWLGTYTDIDEQRRSRAALDQFKSTLDAVRDGVWIFDPDALRFAYVNEGASRLAGYDRAELLTMGPLDLVPAADAARLPATLAQLRSGSRDVLTLETVQRRRDGSTHPVELSLQYITPPGEDGRFVAIVRDITERRRADEERAHLYGEAQAAVRARDEFLSIASHELKTPLTALKLYVKTLLRAVARAGAEGAPGVSAAPTERADGVPIAQFAGKLEAIDRQVDRLTKLINNLLDVSRITAGRIDLELDDVDLAALVREIADRAREELSRAGCPLTLRANEVVIGRWDPLRLDQVITNLLSNAIKYGNGKPIELVLATDGPTARVTVRDHGIGIAPDHQARIFQRFERAVSERQYGGLGLGLWICRQIVNALSGEIAVASTPGEGSTFTVTLPCARDA
jgi:PAS domain S-box-containing protein